jgi:hypothetical protein
MFQSDSMKFHKIHLFAGIILASISWASVSAAKDLIVPIAGLSQTTISPGVYVQSLYKWGIGIGALLAVLMLVFGGVEYVLSAGSFAENSAAKERIKSTILGIIILLGASLILTIINPKLTNLNVDRPEILSPANIKTLQDQFAALKTQMTQRDALGNRTLIIDDSTTAENIGKQLALSEKAAVDDPLLHSDEHNKNIEDVNNYVNDYFGDEAYKQKITAALKKQFNGSDPSDIAVQRVIASRQKAAYDKLTEDLDEDNPAIKSQKEKIQRQYDAAFK